MTISFYMNCVSLHQLPLAREVSMLVTGVKCTADGESGFLYVDAGVGGQPMQTLKASDDLGVKVAKIDTEEAREAVETWDVVVTGLRDLELIERRESKGLRTFYYSERWFKPIEIGLKVFGLKFSIPGWVRMFAPRYGRMAMRFVKWANTDPGARVLAIGPHARRDFLRMGVRDDKIIPWGYFVSPSVEKRCRCRKAGDPLKVLWAGRDIPLKHVPDIECAVALANKNLSKEIGCSLIDTQHALFVTFTKLTGVSPAVVREAMREHDTFVFASNAYEGWGAVVSEALEEGMNVIGTWECGAAPALLPAARLYHCGDVRALAQLLEKEYNNELPQCSIGEWTAKNAAKRLMEMI